MGKTIIVEASVHDKSETPESVKKPHKYNSEKKGISRPMIYSWPSTGSHFSDLLLIICKINIVAPFFFPQVICSISLGMGYLLLWIYTCVVIKGERQGLLFHGTRGAFAIILISQTCRCNYSWPASSCHPHTHVPLNGRLYLPTHPKITSFSLA